MIIGTTFNVPNANLDATNYISHVKVFLGNYTLSHK